MTPLYFGSSARRLFGLYTPGHGQRGSRAVLLCPPLGQEYLCAHRSLRQLGNQLAAAGYHVLRFDYYGTGDSGGDMPDADLKGWEADIVTAIEELKDTSGALRVSLVGLRLGGTLAARVAAGHPRDVQALALWDAVVDGGQYMSELLNAGGGETPGDAPPTPRAAECGGGHEILGFPIPARLESDIRAIDLAASVPALPKRTLALSGESGIVNSRLAAAMAARAAEGHAVEVVDGQPAWLNDAQSGAGAVPVRQLQRIVEWVAS